MASSRILNRRSAPECQPPAGGKHLTRGNSVWVALRALALAAGCGSSGSPSDEGQMLATTANCASDIECNASACECRLAGEAASDVLHDSVPACPPVHPTPEGIKWIPIPGGSFLMGCSPGDNDCKHDEFPRHAVTLPPFQMLETEVTEAQYAGVLHGHPAPCTNDQPSGDDLPVTCVEWFNSRDFCEAVGGRLPTEAEWEYAARAGTTTRFYCGDDPTCLDDFEWPLGNGLEVKPVMKKEPNPLGLYDMAGNVVEWTNDWYDELYYESSPTDNPQGPDGGYKRTVRGASFDSISARWGDNPSGCGTYVGFRCARDVEP